MNTDVYNAQGEKTGTVKLPDSVFGIAWAPDLVHQVVVSQMANRRQGTVHTKGRGEVSGGGKKPWRQKGTGRARHGSTRSPIWVGGGVAFGPTKDRNFTKKINKKMRVKALFAVLSAKAKANQLLLVDTLHMEKPSTKILQGMLKKLPVENKSCLLALPAMDKSIIAATQNLAKTRVMQAKDLNAFDILSSQFLVMPQDALPIITQTFVKK
jgi:large subunit ribosomal protein L4